MPTAHIANIIAGVLLTQLVLGGLQLFSFYHVNKRFVSSEFPAQIARIDGRFGAVEKQQEALWTEVRQLRRDVDRHDIILERRDRGGGEDLDDTRGGGPRRRRT